MKQGMQFLQPLIRYFRELRKHHCKQRVSCRQLPSRKQPKCLMKLQLMVKLIILTDLKENVIVGHLIPAGTGLRDFENLVVGNKEEYEKLKAGSGVEVPEPTEN